jgi:hypothetical protein
VGETCSKSLPARLVPSMRAVLHGGDRRLPANNLEAFVPFLCMRSIDDADHKTIPEKHGERAMRWRNMVSEQCDNMCVFLLVSVAKSFGHHLYWKANEKRRLSASNTTE